MCMANLCSDEVISERTRFESLVVLWSDYRVMSYNQFKALKVGSAVFGTKMHSELYDDNSKINEVYSADRINRLKTQLFLFKKRY